MKRIIYLLSLVFLFGCDSENAWDCIQDSGEIVAKEFNVEAFKRIQVWERVQLIISQGAEQNIRVETGENLMNEIMVRVQDSILTISDRNSCNWVRDYGITKVYVTTPNITEIRNSSGLTVESQGVIAFEELSLVSEDEFNVDEFHIDGDFNMTLNVRTLKVTANGLSKFYLKGNAYSAFFGLNDGDVRVEAGDLEVTWISFIHRSTNKLIVNPQISLKGQIRGIGDVISKNRPPIVEVEELYTGRLIFE